jgi:hypothetical protein
MSTMGFKVYGLGKRRGGEKIRVSIRPVTVMSSRDEQGMIREKKRIERWGSVFERTEKKKPVKARQGQTLA